MKNNNLDKFIEYIEGSYSESRANSIKVVYKSLLEYFKKTNKSVENFTKEDIIDFFNSNPSRGYGGLQTKLSAVKDIVKYFTNSNINLKITELKDKSLIPDNRYFSESEIEELANMLINPQDKAIVLLLFNRVMGKDYEDIINIKVKDIDLEKRIIHLKNRTLYMNEALFDVIKDTIESEVYFKYIDDVNDGSTNKSYYLNPSCEFLLKPKRFSKNNDGMNPFKVNGIQRRLSKLSEVTGVKLTGKSLTVSGVISNINNDNIEIKVSTIESWLNENNINLNAYEVYRNYKCKFISN